MFHASVQRFDGMNEKNLDGKLNRPVQDSTISLPVPSAATIINEGSSKDDLFINL